MSQKVANIKDWMLYLEDGKTKAFDITKHDNTDELRELCSEAGIPVIGYCSFEYEKDATHYGEMM